MPLYIVNCSRQHLNFNYRLIECRQPYFLIIKSGHQEMLPGWDKFNDKERDYVIEQLERNGAVEFSAINQKPDDFSGIMFSTGRPATSEKIEQGSEVVLDLAEKRSVRAATLAAESFDAQTMEGGTRGRRLARITEVEIKQESLPNERFTGDEAHFRRIVGRVVGEDLQERR
jgi:hypothetical protein